MDQKIIAHLDSHRLGIMSEIDDQQVHSACMHYSYKLDPFEIIFVTKNDSRKASILSQGPIAASVVIGFSEDEWITLQLDGETKIVDESLRSEYAKVHFAKFPDYTKYATDYSRIFLSFKPSWWRYTEFKSDPVVMIEETK